MCSLEHMSYLTSKVSAVKWQLSETPIIYHLLLSHKNCYKKKNLASSCVTSSSVKRALKVHANYSMVLNKPKITQNLQVRKFLSSKTRNFES